MKKKRWFALRGPEIELDTWTGERRLILYIVCPLFDDDGTDARRDLRDRRLEEIRNPTTAWRVFPALEQDGHRLVAWMYQPAVFLCRCGAAFAFEDAEIYGQQQPPPVALP